MIQQFDFRSKNKPSIIFEPGNRMKYLKDRDIRGLQGPGSCNHWPVGQAVCDGRTSQAADRPTHGDTDGDGDGEDSAADGAGLRKADVLMEINREPIKDAYQFSTIYKRAKDRVLLLVYRDGGSMYLLLEK